MINHDRIKVDAASPPWAGSYRRYEERRYDNGNRHRGWTMVQSGRWFWATNDRNVNDRFRVCREVTPFGEALRTFRRMVDEMLEAQVEVEG